MNDRFLLFQLGFIVLIVAGCSFEGPMPESAQIISATDAIATKSTTLNDYLNNQVRIGHEMVPINCFEYDYSNRSLEPNPSGTMVLANNRHQVGILNSADYQIDRLEAFDGINIGDLVWANDSQFLHQILTSESDYSHNTYQISQVDHLANSVWDQPFIYKRYALLASSPLAISPTNASIALPEEFGITIYDPAANVTQAQLQYGRDAISIRGFSPDGMSMVTILFAKRGAEDSRAGEYHSIVRIMDIDEPDNFIDIDEIICYKHAGWSPSGKFLATMGHGQLHVYKVESWSKIYSSSIDDNVVSFSWSTFSDRLAIESTNQEYIERIDIIDLPAGNLAHSVNADKIVDVEFLGDDDTIVYFQHRYDEGRQKLAWDLHVMSLTSREILASHSMVD